MKPPFLSPDGATTITGAALKDAIDELCGRRSFLQLASPYLTFPAHALERQGGELHVRTTLTKDFVTRTLGTQPLRIRFPWGLGMAGGAVKVLGYQQEDGKRILRVKLPSELVDEDRRAAIRLEPPAQGTAMLSPDGESLVRAKVEELSVLGTRVFALEPLSSAFVDNHPLQLSLNLELGPRLNLRARLVHQDGQTLGLAFPATMEAPLRQEIEAFLLPELDKARHRWDNRAELRAAAQARVKLKAPPEGVLLLGRDTDLESQLRKVLPEALPLRSCPPALAPLRAALEAPPKLILLHLLKGGIEERFLLRSLVDALPAATPVVVLGAPGVVSGREVAADLKATTFVEWNPTQAPFFSRLLQGLVRKHWGAED
jgi:hypothetical protein